MCHQENEEAYESKKRIRQLLTNNEEGRQVCRNEEGSEEKHEEGKKEERKREKTKKARTKENKDTKTKQNNE